MHSQVDSVPDSLGAVILAAGKGTRMYSSKPKVLHELLQVSMLNYVYNALQPIVREKIWSVIGFGAQMIVSQFPEQEASFIYQKEQLGTGHALQTAIPVLASQGLDWCLVVNGDAPLISTDALYQFVQQAGKAGCALSFMTLQLADPAAYGRVLRNENGDPQAIIEAKDFRTELHGYDSGEVNSGIYLLYLPAIAPLLENLSCDNEQKEFYITQLVDIAVQKGLLVFAKSCGSDPSYLGVNNAEELVYCEEILRSRIVSKWLSKGVIIRGQNSVRIGPQVIIEPGAEIVGPTEIYGQSRIAGETKIGSHCYLDACTIGEGTVINSFSYLEQVAVGNSCQVGPFARLRPGTSLAQNSRVGNFVEVKNSSLGKSSKANHLAYLGDSSIGEDCNIGAGTITCNYDGKSKHRTLLGDSVFVGSNTSLVAPLKIGNQALIGAGSTITKDVPDMTLAVARERQKNLPRHCKESGE